LQESAGLCMLSYLLSSWSLMPISYMNYLNPANSGDDVPDVSGFGRFLATQQSHASGKVRETSRWKSQKRSRVITTIASGKPHIGTITRLPLPKKMLSPSNFCGMLEPKCVGSRAIPPEVSWFPWNQKVFGWISPFKPHWKITRLLWKLRSGPLNPLICHQLIAFEFGSYTTVSTPAFNPSVPQQLLKLPLSPALGGVPQNNLAGDGEGRSKAWRKASLPAWHQKQGFVWK
jgi:hypothetical protein